MSDTPTFPIPAAFHITGINWADQFLWYLPSSLFDSTPRYSHPDIPLVSFRYSAIQDFVAGQYLFSRGTVWNVQATKTLPWSSYATVQDTFVSSYASDRDSALHTIQSMRALGHNWDGFGAVPVLPEITDLAAAILFSLPPNVPAPEVSANPNGTVSFEWENEQGRAHLELGRTKYSLYFKRTAGATLYANGFVAGIDDSTRNLLDEMFTPIPPLDYTISDIRFAKAA